MSIQPTFTVKDWAAAEPIMAEFVEATKKETGCVFYGWTKVGDKLFCREAYVDAAAVLAHLDNIGALVGKLLESAATLDGIELHGAYEEVDKCKEKMDAFGTTYWKHETSLRYGVSFMRKETGAKRAPMTLMTIQPTFTVKDWDAAAPIMKEFAEATLDKIELHGPAAEIDKCKGKMDAFGTTYWTI